MKLKIVELQAYTDYLQFLHTINDSVKGVKTSADIPCSAKIIALIDMLEEIQVRK